jgi:hypothetical protein
MNKNHQKIIVMFLFVIVGMSIFSSSVSAGLLSDFFDKIREWFESSPLGGLFARPVKRMTEIDLTFYPKDFALNPESIVNVTSNSTKVLNFNGGISIDLEGNFVVLKESNSQLTIEERLGKIEVHGLIIGNLELKGMKLSMVSGNWTETTDSGSLKMYDFLGKGIIDSDSIELVGNVSKVSKE